MNPKKFRSGLASKLLTATAVLGVTAACGGSTGGTSSSGEDVIKVGVVLSLSGPVASLGQATERGVELAVDEINADGGIGGKELDVTILDDQSDQDVAASSAQRLMTREGVSALLGGSFGTTANAIGVLAERSGVPFVTSTGVVVEEQESWEQVFFTLTNFELVADSLLSHFEQAGHKRIGILRLSREYGQIGSQYLNELAPKHGLEIVAEEQGDDADTSFTSQLTKIRGSDVDAMVVWFANPAGATVLQNMQDLGMDLPVAVPLSMATGSLVEVAGETAEGVTVQAQLAPDDPQERSQEFVNAYNEAHGESPETFDAIGYDLVMILASALEEVGDVTDRELIRDALEELSYEGAGTVVNYGPGQHQPEAESIVLTTVEDGKFVQLREQ